MKPIIGVRMRTGEPLVKQYRQIQAIRQLRGKRQSMVVIDPAIGLRPIKYVAGARTHRGVVQQLNSIGSIFGRAHALSLTEVAERRFSP